MPINSSLNHSAICARVTLYFFSIVAPVTIAQTSFAQTPYTDVEYIDVNNIKAAHSVHGAFWHSFPGGTIDSYCEYPIGSGIHLATSGSLWMGGFDSLGTLHAAATMYRDSGVEYWPGPLQGSATTIDSVESGKWARIWKVDKADIQTFLSASQHTIGNTPPVILDWPATGNAYAKGRNGSPLVITDEMAPFVDLNNNGTYDPLQGDYPRIKGDQMLWFVYTDAGVTPHSEVTMSPAVGMEIKAKVYGYRQPGALNNVLFYEFDLRNAGQTLDSFTIGMFADLDIGDATDDYIGFDSARNMGYAYNGKTFDGMTQPAGIYRDSIPSAGIRMLQFPNNNCNNAAALGSFMYFVNATQLYQRAPDSGMQMYRYLNHTWRYGAPLAAVYNSVTQQIWTDGTGPGAPVSYVYDERMTAYGPWTECDMQEPAEDLRMVISARPFKLNHGQKFKMAFALIASEKRYHNGCPSYNLNNLKLASDEAQYAYCNPQKVGIEETFGNNAEIMIYPNPATSEILVRNLPQDAKELKILDLTGRAKTVLQTKGSEDVSIDLSEFPAGLYFLHITTKNGLFVKKFLKI
jgi:hypothetical protein